MTNGNSGSVTIYGNDIQTTPPTPEDTIKKLDQLTAQTSNILLEIKNTFPFDLFTDKLIIRPTKIDLVYGIFFFSDYILSMLIKDLKTVKVSTGLFFATMSFELQGYETNPPKIKFLSNKKAMQARRIIAGLMAAHQNNVDLAQLPIEDLSGKVEEIGRAREE